MCLMLFVFSDSMVERSGVGKEALAEKKLNLELVLHGVPPFCVTFVSCGLDNPGNFNKFTTAQNKQFRVRDPQPLSARFRLRSYTYGFPKNLRLCRILHCFPQRVECRLAEGIGASLWKPD